MDKNNKSSRTAELQLTSLTPTKGKSGRTRILAYFDPRKDVVLQCDASQKGLGAALLHERQHISYSSRCLPSAEQNYVQIEKELRAVVFACERFHQYSSTCLGRPPSWAATCCVRPHYQCPYSCQRAHPFLWWAATCNVRTLLPGPEGVRSWQVLLYTYGRDITVQSDHKPLEAITNKPLACAPPRLQRMLLRLQRYNVKVVYVPGKQIPLADTPSRIFLKTKSMLPRDDLEDSARVHETWPPVNSAKKLESSRSFRPPSLMHESKRSELQCNMTSPWLLEHSRWTRNRRPWIVTTSHQGLRIVIPFERCEEILQQLCFVLVMLYTGLASTQISRCSSQDARHGRNTCGHHKRSPWWIDRDHSRWWTWICSSAMARTICLVLLQLLHRSREALLNPCIIHHHEDENNPCKTWYTGTGVLRQWAAVFLHGICKIFKHTRIRPLDIHSRMG